MSKSKSLSSVGPLGERVAGKRAVQAPRRARAALGLALLALAAGVACTGVVGDDEVIDGSVAIVGPSAGALVVRNHLTGSGALVAQVSLHAEASEGVARVVWSAGGRVLGESLPPAFAVEAVFDDAGAVEVTAVAEDASGDEVGRATLSFDIEEEVSPSCREILDRLGVDYEVGPAKQGVADPVTVEMPINGLRLRNSGELRQKTFMGCELALALWRAAEVLDGHGVHEMGDYGIYNYRCINQSVEPPCPGSKLSMHAYALAIDIATLRTDGGEVLSVNDDWVIDPDGTPTCDAATEAGKDTQLHDMLCDLAAHRVFAYYLTPNYNDAHRNHFHLDLTPGGRIFVGKPAAVAAESDE